MLAGRGLWFLIPCALFVVGSPAAVFDRAELDPAKVDAVFADLAVDGSPGCALAVFAAGEVLYTKGYGLAQLENRVPITPETVFDIGSTSKQLTAALILLLSQEGKLSLDDDLRKYVPEIPDYGVQVTLRHLLHHTSGIRDYINLMILGGFRIEDHTTAEDALVMITRQKALDFSPGAEHSYSNSGYFLLSVIAERASGKSLKELGQEKIFGPLGMKDTQILDDHTRVIARRASSYEPGEEQGFVLSTSAWEQTGDGAVQTTVLDLAKWDANFYEPKVGGPQLVAALQEKGLLSDGSTIDYARGLNVTQHRGLPMVLHGGSWMGFRAEMVRFPGERLSVATLCNLGSADPSRRALAVAELLLADRLAPLPAADVASGGAVVEAGRYEGLWWGESSGAVRQTVAREGKLFYQRGPGNLSELAARGDGRFVMLGTPGFTTVTIAGATGARRMEVVSGSGRPNRFLEVRPAAKAAAPEPGLAGRYASSELDSVFTLDIEAGKLLLRPKRGEALELVPAFHDAFLSPQGVLIRVRRGSGGQVEGLWLDMGRARNIELVKLAP